MTLKRKRLTDEYIISGNATEAAINAGYSEKTANRIASENLSKLDIKTYIDERMAKVDSKKIADQKEIMQYWTSVMRESQRQILL